MSNIYLKEWLNQERNINIEKNNDKQENKAHEENFCNLDLNLKQLIIVNSVSGSKAILEMFERDNKAWIKILEADAFIGRNGITNNKREGDEKTPSGRYKLGIAFGMHDAEEINISKDLEYIKINKNLYWVDDVHSKFYNQLVDITKVDKDWKSAEHLIEYPRQYEYALEIKTNPNNIPGKGSAIFLHCSVGNPTAGCVAIDRIKMLKVLQEIKKNTLIWII